MVKGKSPAQWIDIIEGIRNGKIVDRVDEKGKLVRPIDRVTRGVGTPLEGLRGIVEGLLQKGSAIAIRPEIEKRVSPAAIPPENRGMVDQNARREDVRDAVDFLNNLGAKLIGILSPSDVAIRKIRLILYALGEKKAAFDSLEVKTNPLDSIKDIVDQMYSYGRQHAGTFNSKMDTGQIEGYINALRSHMGVMEKYIDSFGQDNTYGEAVFVTYEKAFRAFKDMTAQFYQATKGTNMDFFGTPGVYKGTLFNGEVMANHAGHMKRVLQPLLDARSQLSAAVVQELEKKFYPGQASGSPRLSLSGSASAILPENLGKVNEMANEGKTALRIAVWVAMKEFLGSFLSPREFIAGYGADQRGAKLVVYAGILGGLSAGIVTMATLGFAAPILAVVMGMVAGVTAGAAVNIGTHVLLDWHYISRSGLIEAINSFGAGSMDKEGNVRTQVYVVAGKPTAEDGPRNTGINVNEGPVWGSTKDGALVLFSGSADPAVVGETIDNMMRAKGGIDGSMKLKERLSELIRAVGVEMKGMDISPDMSIDHRVDGKKMRYNSLGSLVVSADMFKDVSGEYGSREQIAGMLKELKTIRDAESVAMPQNMFIDLDDVKTLGEFKGNVEAFDKAGNGQMIVDPVIFDELKVAEKEVKIRELIQLAKGSGVRIYVDLTRDNSPSRQVQYRQLGFEGYAVSDEAGTNIYIYGEGGAMLKAEAIGGYSDAEQLKEKISKSAAANMVLKLSELKGLLRGERSFIERVALTEILKTTVLNFYNANSLNERYVRNVAYGWERKELPALPRDVQGLTESIREGKAEGIVVAMGIGEVSHGVKTYLTKLENEVKDEKKLELLKKAFLTVIVERMLAKTRLEEAGKANGLADENLEKILGQALLKQKIGATEKEGVSITVDKFTAGYENKAAIELYMGLRVTVEELAVDSSPKAINTIIELIPPLGEPKIIRDNRKADTKFNAKSVEAVLGAA
jgi:hypothetical protein